MGNSVLPETKTLVFSISSYVPNVPDVRARPETFSRQFVLTCRCFYFSLSQFVHIIKRTLHVGLKILILFSRVKSQLFTTRK